MTHPDEQILLLYAYGEASEPDSRGVEEHLAACPGCRRGLEEIERGRLLAELGLARRAPRRRRIVPAAALAAAAMVAGIVLINERMTDAQHPLASTPTSWSVPAGYVTGGAALVAVDSILSRLEQEVSHARR